MKKTLHKTFHVQDFWLKYHAHGCTTTCVGVSAVQKVMRTVPQKRVSFRRAAQQASAPRCHEHYHPKSQRVNLRYRCGIRVHFGLKALCLSPWRSHLNREATARNALGLCFVLERSNGCTYTGTGRNGTCMRDCYLREH
eukprot:2008261-Amphidinium_carterae.1